MKIEPFKMRVTPEQNRRVQEIIFENGGEWRDGQTTVINTNFPGLAFDLSGDGGGISGWSDPFAGLPTFSDAKVPEITYDEFITKYAKQMKNLKLEVGKTYLDRNGERVEIVGDNGHEMFPFEGDNCLSYTLDGHWDFERDSVFDLIAEAEAPTAQPGKRTFKIPENTREISVNEMDGRIVIEFVPEVPEFKEGDIVCGEAGNPYILKNMEAPAGDRYYAWTRGGHVSYGGCSGYTGPAVRLATPAEAQQLFDALAKDGKRWNAETLKIEELTERERIRAWLKAAGWWGSEDLAAMIETYIKEREAQQ